ncbi:helix-turn-helix transcriptional regulator [Maribacter sp. 2307ULW6-5]|uniref:helix-turn-helix transcriptional regulator n=1 Tax=Maribacter sp. 2307ULW6-5 TaxID=3386275 RepID=UPI0039BCC701
MASIQINKTSALQTLNTICDVLQGKLSTGMRSAEMLLNNSLGKGRILALEFPEISCLCYDIQFNEEIGYEIRETEHRHLYFIYVLAGHFLHKQQHEEHHHTIRPNQNIISEVPENGITQVAFPKDVHLRFVAINVNHRSASGRIGSYLQELGGQMVAALSARNADQRLHYVGQPSFKAMDIITSLRGLDAHTAMGSIQAESAILALLAAQLEEHRNHLDPEPKLPLYAQDLKKLQHAVEHIHGHLGQKHSVQQLSKRVGLSPKKLQFLFRSMFATTVVKYINDLRLEKSRELLLQRHLNISEVAQTLGFANGSYFNKMFKQRFGESPLAFKRKNQG